MVQVRMKKTWEGGYLKKLRQEIRKRLQERRWQWQYGRKTSKNVKEERVTSQRTTLTRNATDGKYAIYGHFPENLLIVSCAKIEGMNVYFLDTHTRQQDVDGAQQS
jgi:hypothetical protein